MDRLPPILYHATPPGNVQGILRRGLVPQDESHAVGSDGVHLDRVFLSKFDDPRYMNLPADKINDAVVLAVDTSHIDPARLYPDDSIYGAYFNDQLEDADIGTMFPDHYRRWGASGSAIGFGEWMDDEDNGPSNDEVESALAGRFGLTLWNSGGMDAPFELGEAGYGGRIPPEAVSLRAPPAALRSAARRLAGDHRVELAGNEHGGVTAFLFGADGEQVEDAYADVHMGAAEDFQGEAGQYDYFNPNEPIEESGTVAVLTGLELPEDLRGRGLGREMVEAAVGWALSHGAEAVYTHSVGAPGDPGPEGFYERLGFEAVDRDSMGNPYMRLGPVRTAAREPAFLKRLRDADALPAPADAAAALSSVMGGTLIHHAAGSTGTPGEDLSGKIQSILDSGLDPAYWAKPWEGSPGERHPQAVYLSLAWPAVLDDLPPNYVLVEPRLSRPLVLLAGDADGDYAWGPALNEATGKSGAGLSSFLRARGYDSVITVHKYGVGEVAYFGKEPLPAFLPEPDRTARTLEAAAEAVGRAAAVEDIYRGVKTVIEKYRGKGLFARFSDVPKVGIRPSTEHHDPYGVYFYPVDWLAENAGFGTTYVNLPYITVARIRRSGWLNLATVRPAKARELAEKGGVLEEYEARTEGKGLNQAKGGRAGKRLWDAVEAKVRPFESEANKMEWNRIFGRMGVKAVYDPGTGSVNSAEPSQIVVLDLSLIEVVDVVDNKEDRKSVFYAVLKAVADEVLDGGWRVSGSHAEGGIMADGTVSGRPVAMSVMPAKAGFEMEVTLSYHDPSGRKRRIVSRGRMPNEWEDAPAAYLSEGHVRSISRRLEEADIGPGGGPDAEDMLGDALRALTSLRLPDLTVEEGEGGAKFWKNTGDGKIEGSLKVMPDGRRELELYAEDWLLFGGEDSAVIEIGPMRVSWEGDPSSASADMASELSRAVRELRVTDDGGEAKESIDRDAAAEIARMRTLSWMFPDDILQAAGQKYERKTAAALGCPHGDYRPYSCSPGGVWMPPRVTPDIHDAVSELFGGACTCPRCRPEARTASSVEERCWAAASAALAAAGFPDMNGMCLEASVVLCERLRDEGVDAELVRRRPGEHGGHWTVRTPAGEFDPTIAWWGDSAPEGAESGRLYEVGDGSPHAGWEEDAAVDEAAAYRIAREELGVDDLEDLYGSALERSLARGARRVATPHLHEPRCPLRGRHDGPPLSDIGGDIDMTASAATSFGGLPGAVRADITENLHDAFFAGTDVSHEVLRGVLEDMDTPLPTARLPVAELAAQARATHRMSDTAVANLADTLRRVGELDPILVDAARLHDGGHRVMAYEAEGRDTIPTVDMAPLFAVDWETEFNEEIPGLARVASSGMAALGETVPYEGELWHGTSLGAAASIARGGFRTQPHEEMSCESVSLTRNRRAAEIFAARDGVVFGFDARLDRLFVLPEFVYDAMICYRGSGACDEEAEGRIVENADALKRIGALPSGWEGDAPPEWSEWRESDMDEHDWLTRSLPGHDGVIVPGFGSTQRNAETEIAVFDTTASRLRGMVTSIAVDGKTYDTAGGDDGESHVDDGWMALAAIAPDGHDRLGAALRAVAADMTPPPSMRAYRAVGATAGPMTDAMPGGTYFFPDRGMAELWAGDRGTIIERILDTSGASVQDVPEGEMSRLDPGTGAPFDTIIRRDPDGSGSVLEIVVFDESLISAALSRAARTLGKTRYWHGSSGENIRASAAAGFVDPGVPEGAPCRGYQKPMPGRTYATTDLGYALIYAIGAAMVGEELPEGRGFEGEGGVVSLEGDGSPLPDEDWIGELISDCERERRGRRGDPNAFKGEVPEWKGELYGDLRRSLPGRVVSMIDRKPTWKLDEMAVQSMIGKNVNRWLLKQSPEHAIRKELVARSPHHSHLGRMRVTGAWVFDKMEINPKLKKDGSNFLEMATGIPVAEPADLITAAPSRAARDLGAPRVEGWHGTESLGFTTFDGAFSHGQLGFHFGTEEQAAGLLGEDATVPRVIRAELDIRNPLRMPDLGGWVGHAAKEEFERALGVRIPGSGSDASIVRAIRDAGHDGIVYGNRFEGEGDSYIVFDASQIRIVDDTAAASLSRAARCLKDMMGSMRAGALDISPTAASPRWYYHGSAPDDILDIAQWGLLARDDRDGVSVTTEPEKAKAWAGLKSSGRDIEIFRIPASALPDLTPENAAPAEPDKDFTAGRQIPPEHLEIVRDGKWKPLLDVYGEFLDAEPLTASLSKAARAMGEHLGETVTAYRALGARHMERVIREGFSGEHHAHGVYYTASPERGAFYTRFFAPARGWGVMFELEADTSRSTADVNDATDAQVEALFEEVRSVTSEMMRALHDNAGTDIDAHTLESWLGARIVSEGYYDNIPEQHSVWQLIADETRGTGEMTIPEAREALPPGRYGEMTVLDGRGVAGVDTGEIEGQSQAMSSADVPPDRLTAVWLPSAMLEAAGETIPAGAETMADHVDVIPNKFDTEYDYEFIGEIERQRDAARERADQPDPDGDVPGQRTMPWGSPDRPRMSAEEAEEVSDAMDGILDRWRDGNESTMPGHIYSRLARGETVTPADLDREEMLVRYPLPEGRLRAVKVVRKAIAASGPGRARRPDGAGRGRPEGGREADMTDDIARALRRAAENIDWSEESDVDPESFTDEGFVEDESGHAFWGSQGSGCLFVRNHPDAGPQLLLVKRSPHVEEPNTWGTTGGAVPKGESNLFASAVRETREEIGSIPPYEAVRQYVWKAPGGTFTYTTFILECTDMGWLPAAFNWEATDARWVSLEEASSYDLHFGLVSILEDLGESLFPGGADE